MMYFWIALGLLVLWLMIRYGLPAFELFIDCVGGLLDGLFSLFD